MSKDRETLKLEIEFYKDLAGKTFTANILTLASTVALFRTQGMTAWVVTGFVASAFLTSSYALFLHLWKKRIKEFEEAN
jgi:hypothetical protein